MKAMNILIAATALSLVPAAAIAGDKEDAIILQDATAKIANARNDPGVAKHGFAELDRATVAVKKLEKNLDDDDAIDTKSILGEIDALVATAKMRAKIAELEQTAEVEQSIDLQAAKADALASQAKVAALQEQLSEYKLKQTKAGAMFIMEDVIFETGKATLRPGAVERLKPLVEYLRTNDVRVSVAGHTDSRGSADYNMRLSDARASAVKSMLTAAGVDAARIDVMGYGETKPVASNQTSAGQQANRRVEITLLGQQLAMQATQ